MEVFTYVPEFGAARPTKPSVSNIKFGDGYEQRVAHGINTIQGHWDLTFANRDLAESQAIDDFLTARGGAEAFLWTPPGESLQKKWKCQDWTMSLIKGNYRTIQAVFEEVYDPS